MSHFPSFCFSKTTVHRKVAISCLSSVVTDSSLDCSHCPGQAALMMGLGVVIQSQFETLESLKNIRHAGLILCPIAALHWGNIKKQVVVLHVVLFHFSRIERAPAVKNFLQIDFVRAVAGCLRFSKTV